MHFAEIHGASHLQQARHILLVRVRSGLRTAVFVLARIAAALALLAQRAPERDERRLCGQ